MSSPFVGQLALFPYNFAPANWAQCNGQLLQISQHAALFSLLGPYYGGDGRTTFALPDLRGRLPNGYGQGPGLSNYPIGQRAGAPTVTLQSAQMAPHTHTIPAYASAATTGNPVGEAFAEAAVSARGGGTPINTFVGPGSLTPVSLNASTVAQAGGSGAHNNQQPTLVLTWCIALSGVFPARQ